MSPPAKKNRLDRVLVERGLAPSRERAAALIMAGAVRVNDRVIDKAGAHIPADAQVTLLHADHPFVGRGGLKLDAALTHFALDVRGTVCLDAGASTGGFTDCLLQRGAARVHAVDVGHGQLAWKLQQDPRVLRHDHINVRTLEEKTLGELVDLITLDLAFISLTGVLPAVTQLATAHARLITLIKPQFEVGRALVGKGGIVRDAAAREAAVDKVVNAAVHCAWQHHGTIPSPITGADGNQEFLAYFTRALVETTRLQ